MFDAYRQGAEEAGHAHGPEQIAVRRMVTFVDAPSQQREAVNRAKRALLDVLTASAGPLPPWASLLDRPDESIAALSDEEFVSGTPQQVAEQLIEQCQIIGAGHLLGGVQRARLPAARRKPRVVQLRGRAPATRSERCMMGRLDRQGCTDHRHRGRYGPSRRAAVRCGGCHCRRLRPQSEYVRGDRANGPRRRWQHDRDRPRRSVVVRSDPTVDRRRRGRRTAASTCCTTTLRCRWSVRGTT